MGGVLFVNQHDSVSNEGLQFKGNDTLSAYVAIVCESDLLVNLSDVDGMYDSDPRKNPDAKLLSRIDEITDAVRASAGGAGSALGTGGMETKVQAAEIAGAAGIPMLLLSGKDPSILYSIIDGKKIGTYFAASKRSRDDA